MITKKEPVTECEKLPAVLLRDIVSVHAVTINKILLSYRLSGGEHKSAYGGGCCCCCCCCCCKQHDKAPAPARDVFCDVEDFAVSQELRLDPNSFGTPGGPVIVGTRASISWRVIAPVGSVVNLQIRTRTLNGEPGGAFRDWTNTSFVNQELIDNVQFNFDGLLGTKVEFRVVVVDGDGTLLCAGEPDS